VSMGIECKISSRVFSLLLSCRKKIGMCYQTLMKVPKIKFLENPFSDSRIFTCGHKKRRNERKNVLESEDSFLQLLVSDVPSKGERIIKFTRCTKCTEQLCKTVRS
jgi:hypothetical protein